MEDKNILNENELEKVSGGKHSDSDGIELCLYCADCGYMLFHGLPEDVFDIMEEKKHYYEQNHCCCSGKVPPEIRSSIYITD